LVVSGYVSEWPQVAIGRLGVPAGKESSSGGLALVVAVPGSAMISASPDDERYLNGVAGELLAAAFIVDAD
jgi:hypothetical protein